MFHINAWKAKINFRQLSIAQVALHFFFLLEIVGQISFRGGLRKILN